MKKKLLCFYALSLSFFSIAHTNHIDSQIIINTQNNITFPTLLWNEVADTSWYTDAANEFTINTAEQLAGLASLVQNGNNFSGKTIVLAQSIDLNGKLWTPIGTGVNLPFSGTFDGNNNTISNLFVHNDNGEFLGLFGQVFQGVVKNTNINIANVKGKGTAAALVGNLSTASTIENCHATNINIEVTPTQNLGTGYNAGGICGAAITNSSIKKSSAQGIVSGFAQIGGLIGSPWNKVTISECSFIGTVNGENISGGLVGFITFSMFPNTEVIIENCFARGTINGNDITGGFVGKLESGIIKNSYSAMTINGVENIGGFAGGLSGNGLFTNCYFDNSMTNAAALGIGSSTEIIGKNTAELKNEDILPLLNANNSPAVWYISTNINEGYPAFSHSNLSVKLPEALAKNIKVYPTVVTDLLYIETPYIIKGYHIYDAAGKLIQSINTDHKEIDTKYLSSGNYFIHIDTEQGVSSHKIIKK